MLRESWPEFAMISAGNRRPVSHVSAILSLILFPAVVLAQPTVELTEIVRFDASENCGDSCHDQITHIATTDDPREFAYIITNENSLQHNRIVRSRFGMEAVVARGSDLISGYCGQMRRFASRVREQKIDVFEDNLAFLVGNPQHSIVARAVGWSDGVRPELASVEDSGRFLQTCNGNGWLPGSFGEFSEVAILDSTRMLISEGSSNTNLRRLHLATRDADGWSVEQRIPPAPGSPDCQTQHLTRAWGIHRLTGGEALLAGYNSAGHFGVFRYSADTGAHTALVLSGQSIPGTNQSFERVISCAADGDNVAFNSFDDHGDWGFYRLSQSTGEIDAIIHRGEALPGGAIVTLAPYAISVSGPFICFATRFGVFVHFDGEIHRVLGWGSVIEGVGTLTDDESYLFHSNSSTSNILYLTLRHGSVSVAFQARLDNLLPGDRDADGIPDEFDNCPLLWQPHQEDWDADGVGDLCDDDIDDDGVPNADDACLRTQIGVPVAVDGRPRSDLNGDCIANGLDLQIMVQRLLAGG